MSIKRRIPVAGVGSCGGDAFHDTDRVNGAALGGAVLSLRERQSGLLPVVPFYAVGLDAGSLIATAAVADVCVTFNGGHSLAGREQPTFCFNSDYSGCGFEFNS